MRHEDYQGPAVTPRAKSIMTVWRFPTAKHVDREGSDTKHKANKATDGHSAVAKGSHPAMFGSA